MPQLYIPPLRVKFILLEDWTFPLHVEMRNRVFAEFIEAKYELNESGYVAYDSPPVNVTVPKGTVMHIERYYIKNGGRDDFDSVTFRAWFGKKSQRFWSKLADANRIQAVFTVPA